MMRKDLGYIRQQKDISEEKRMKKNVWIAGVTALLSAGLVWIAPVSTLADERIPDGVSLSCQPFRTYGSGSRKADRKLCK